MQYFEKISETTILVSATAASAMAVIAVYYVFTVSQKPRIHTSNNRIRNFLQDRVKTLDDKYYPSIYFWEGRLQSVMGLRLRLSPTFKLPYRREIVPLSDGGEVGIDFMEPDEKNVKGPPLKVFLLPGLTSSSQTSYIKTLAMCILKAGATVIVFNHRGLGGVPIKTPRLYSASNCDDVSEVVAYLKKKYPGERMIAIGTSMGGMVFCQYIIQNPEEARETFICAMAISICWDAVNGVANLEKPFVNHYIINYGLTQNLKFLSRKYREVLEVRDCWDFNKILRSTNLREFDSSFTAPQFGFPSALDYYKSANIVDDTEKFTIPVFGFSAADDPMQPIECLPIEQAESPGSNLAMIVTMRGGHLGFLEGPLPLRKPFHYLERVVGDFVHAVRLYGEEMRGDKEVNDNSNTNSTCNHR
ncbi:unnamed protein product [Orchesella dallaii]|uniref:AB hydrolase-1 domain-containing protein n=1 Tax=Orchesella dallaii TaxID=48710 RepID=A0ABP1QSQ2_9HEXA